MKQEVIEDVANSKTAGNVTVTMLAEFTDGRRISIQRNAFCDAPEVIVRRARSQLGKRAYPLVQPAYRCSCWASGPAYSLGWLLDRSSRSFFFPTKRRVAGPTIKDFKISFDPLSSTLEKTMLLHHRRGDNKPPAQPFMRFSATTWSSKAARVSKRAARRSNAFSSGSTKMCSSKPSSKFLGEVSLS
jgi:hypothetical protein